MFRNVSFFYFDFFLNNLLLKKELKMQRLWKWNTWLCVLEVSSFILQQVLPKVHRLFHEHLLGFSSRWLSMNLKARNFGLEVQNKKHSFPRVMHFTCWLFKFKDESQRQTLKTAFPSFQRLFLLKSHFGDLLLIFTKAFYAQNLA